MNGIDCPERKQDYYQVCKDALAQFIFGKNVQLTTHGKDRYQRTVADVFYKNENINIAMIENGFAWHYKKYSSDERMAQAEQNARIKKIGLWKMKDAMAPWTFRKLNKTKKEKAFR
jgi:endonuclease YncB( thermonuclease family)